ncbi:MULTISPECIES: YtpR family tRNA-binding protein [unclassified Jeotgalibaca]|uniref:YtpR family tRNA-binding protein n=1 Tax=unclassified Jeotgalibaca TaxID=2621505 RepID=UPI003FD17803
MWLSFYNKEAVGDTLMLTNGDITRSELSTESKGNVTRIFRTETGETVSYNVFSISETFEPNGNGQVFLTDEQVEKLNTVIQAVGFNDTITIDRSPKFVVGYVKECVPHEDSDHLNITQTEVDNGEVLQIVCGASNIKKDQKVVVAKPGAVMANGLVIWPGELRGVASHGMICSAKELGVENPTGKKGILVLDSDTETGKAFFE